MVWKLLVYRMDGKCARLYVGTITDTKSLIIITNILSYKYHFYRFRYSFVLNHFTDVLD